METTGVETAYATIELLGHLLQVLRDELLDVAVESRLRPAALIVAAGNVVTSSSGIPTSTTLPPGRASSMAARTASG